MSISKGSTIEKALFTIALCLCAVVFYEFASGASREKMNRRWDFENGAADKAPEGFTFARTGNGRQGIWVIKQDGDAPNARFVLAQIDTDSTSYRFPVAVVTEPVIRDLRLSVRCKPVSGKVDQACGVVFRYRDENNYYVARANALEDNVRFYHVSAGKRYELASWTGRITSASWHELRVDAFGDRFEVFWDNERVIGARDKTFSEAGKIGLWTKADSVTYFDDLTVEEPIAR